jgi:glycine cleavage system H protein
MVMINGNNFPEELYYHRDHMWARFENGKVRVGYNDWAQEAAGKILNLNTKKAGRSVKAGKTLGTVESGKWVGPLKSPVSGNISELNEEVLKNPSLINEDPYGKGWVAVIDPSNPETEIEDLLKGSEQESMETWLKEERAKHSV